MAHDPLITVCYMYVFCHVSIQEPFQAITEEVKSLSQEWIVLQNEEDISLFTVVRRDTLPDIDPFVITRSLVLK